MRSNFTITAVVFDVVFLVDECGPNDMSVTNDAEAVVAYVLTKYPKRRIFYRDTDGRWDELDHDGKEFTTFAPLSADDLSKYKEHLT